MIRKPEYSPYIVCIVFGIHTIKYLWMILFFKDKCKVTTKDAFSIYGTISKALRGPNWVDSKDDPIIFRPIFRTFTFIVSLVYLIQAKIKSVYLYFVVIVSFLYMFISFDLEFNHKYIASEASMYGGNLYFIIPILVLLVLHFLYLKKLKN